MLTRKVMQQAIDHRSRDASTAQVRSRPDVDEICIAYAIGKRASGSDDLALVPCDTHALTVLKRLLKLLQCPAIVEIIERERCFQGIPIDPIAVATIFNVHKSVI